MTKKSLSRRSIRLKGYDYLQKGSYYITICVHKRRCLFGDIVNDEMVLNEIGRKTEECWRAIPEHFPHAALDEFVIMPNHIHGIVWIVGNIEDVAEMGNVQAKNFSPVRAQHVFAMHEGKTEFKSPSKTIGSIVRGFKIGVTKWVRANKFPNVRADDYSPQRIWQRNYYEHIIRDDNDLKRVREYIRENPAKWADDRNHPGKKNNGKKNTL